MTLNYTIVDTVDKLKWLHNKLLEVDVVSADTETTGLDFTNSRVICLSLCWSDEDAAVIPLYKNPAGDKYWDDDTFKKIIQWMETLFSSGIKVLWHNAKFDVLMLKHNFGFTAKSDFDTMLAHHLIDENPPHHLKSLAEKFIDPNAKESETAVSESVKANGGKWTQECKEHWKADHSILMKYACYDVQFTFKLYKRFLEQLKRNELLDYFNSDVMPLCHVLTQMEDRGILVNKSYLEKIKIEMGAEITELERQMRVLIGEEIQAVEDVILTAEINKRIKKAKDPEKYKAKLESGKVKAVPPVEFNFKSNDHLGILIFDIMKLGKGKKTKLGKWALDKNAIDDLESDDPVVTYLQQYKKLCKIHSTYVIGTLEQIRSDGRLHTNFKQHGTVTGRLSSSEPNLQNLPADDKFSKLIRRALEADPGYVFISADYSSLEMRMAAHYSEDPVLTKLFREEGSEADPQSAMAKHLFKLEGENHEIKEKFPDKRKIAKTLNFAVLYGAGPYKISKTVGCTKEEAVNLYETYFGSFPRLQKAIKDAHRVVESNGMIKNCFGRIRHLPEAQIVIPQPNVIFEPTPYCYGKKDKRDDPNCACKFVGFCAKETYRQQLIQRKQGAFRQSFNFLCQSSAACLVNRAMIKMTKMLEGFDAQIVHQIHDDIVVHCRADQAEKVMQLMKNAMETAFEFEVPMATDPKVGLNLAEVK